MTIRIHVHTRANRNEVVEVSGDLAFGGASFHAYVTAPPVENKANRAVQELLAKHFKKAKSLVTLISGTKSPIKTFEIN